MALSMRHTAKTIRHLGARSFATTPGIDTVGVIGMGLMGHGIAQIAAEKGYKVVCIDSNAEGLSKGMKAIESSVTKIVDRAVQKGKMDEATAEAKLSATLGNLIKASEDPKDVRDCDIVVEAIVENMDIKNPLYKMLGEECKPETILASNTSSFPVTRMGEASGRPQNMVGLHFFNPVQLMQLVEVVRTEETDPAVFDKTFAFAESLGKTAVKCKDTPGFIVNRLLVPFLAQAMAMVDRGDATPADIDLAMRLGAGHPMGPLHLADYVGHDTNLSILSGWHNEYPEEGAFLVPECLKELNEKGTLGRKTGEGFYKWDGNKLAK